MSEELEKILRETRAEYSNFVEVNKVPYEIGKLHADIPNEHYHKSPGIGSTTLKAFLPESPCPAHYKAYREGLIKPPGADTVALGSAWHALCLEPDKWQDEVRVFPDFPKGEKTEGKAALRADFPHITWIEQDDLNTAMEMRHVLLSHPEVADLFAMINDTRRGERAGQCEVSGWYKDLQPLTGEGTMQLCKYRPDMRYAPEWSNATWIGDLKSTDDASPDAFKRSIDKFGYHISAAHYMEGDHILHGRRPKQFIFICQEKTPPYLVAVYVLGEHTLKYGYHLRRKALEGIHQAKRADAWPHYAYNKATIIDLPHYILNRMEN